MPYFTTSKEVKIFYTKTGKGLPLIFLHGWTMNANIWKYQVVAFKKKFSVITIDFRGHGRSDKSPPLSPPSQGGDLGEVDFFNLMVNDLEEFIASLKLNHIVLIGWSMGAYIAIKYYIKNPKAIKSLVLIGATPRLLASPDFPSGQPFFMIKRLKNKLSRNYQTQITEYCQRFFDDSMIKNKIHFQQITKITVADKYFPPPLPVLLETLKDLCTEDLRKELHKISVPVLIMHGKNDKIASINVVEYLSKQIPLNKTILFSRAGHAPFLTCPEEFNQKLLKWLLIKIK